MDYKDYLHTIYIYIYIYNTCIFMTFTLRTMLIYGNMGHDTHIAWTFMHCMIYYTCMYTLENEIYTTTTDILFKDLCFAFILLQ